MSYEFDWEIASDYVGGTDDTIEFFDDNFAGPPEFLVGDQLLPRSSGMRVEPGQQLQILSAPVPVFDDIRLVTGTPGEALATYFIPINDDLPR